MVQRRKDDIVQFNVRLREGLRKQLEISARDEKRSLNSEIVARLERSIAQRNEALGRSPDDLTELRSHFQTPAQYREAADSCWRLSYVLTGEDQGRMIAMAATWLKLAQAAEAAEARRSKLDTGEAKS